MDPVSIITFTVTKYLGREFLAASTVDGFDIYVLTGRLRFTHKIMNILKLERSSICKR